ncbi:triosephosphate isomerase [Acidisoma cellulosilytica]|uniref:Triosephosphate isomerase n=1 Tax=Acidisoma cellulosilyticum TaxID=2802395 RepID=A0A964E2N0_9PROT|nr:triose-phosphate isomerase [Acidisoma cellulosilyticum]MCB8878988.1 triosephosphate isomerase [Acidisoma cellulosilyticum]
MRKPMVGTGWKMNHGPAAALTYAARLRALLAEQKTAGLDIFVLPPFVSLSAASAGFAGSPVQTGGQNIHWDEAGSWTGEISAPMLKEVGCRYAELAHSERLQHFGETYERVRLKVDAALAADLTPILCLGESAEDKRLGTSDDTLRYQVMTALAGQTPATIPGVVLAYEPRWAIGQSDAAPPDYVAERHAGLRALLVDLWGEKTAEDTRIIYGGSVSQTNGAGLISLPNVDGLFIGRSAWTPEGFAAMVRIVADAKLA